MATCGSTIEGAPDGIIDDCIGKIEIPRNQDIDSEDPLAREVRLERPDGIPDLYLTNPVFGDVFFLSNINSIDYSGYTLEVTRRQYRSWEMNGSYVFSRAIGDGEDYDQLLGDDRSLQREERGYQSNARVISVSDSLLEELVNLKR